MINDNSEVKVLQDVRPNGKERSWSQYKLDSLELAESFKRIGDDGKFSRVKHCGDYLEFRECPEGHEKKLQRAFFCQVRLCPMCSLRRSVLVFNNLRAVVHEAKEKHNVRFVFLTLTAKTVTSETVAEELTKYFKAWERLSKRKKFKDSVLGWFRALEITHNWRKDSYHPHFHCLLAVRPSYFSHGYISHAEWVEMWQKSMRLDYIPIVDVRRVRARRRKKDKIEEEGAIFEVAKYTVKSNDFLIKENRLAQDKAVEILDKALFRRRLVAYGGLLKEIRRQLKQEDEEKADLIKIGDEQTGCTCSVCNAIYEEVGYRWRVGYREYIEESRKPVGVEVDGKIIDPNTGEVLSG
jgi:plasmid rolling circle replication initiator protein Rep